MNDRGRVRFDALPEALKSAIGRDCALIVYIDDVDECRYDIFEARPDGFGVVVSRQCWWFDEEVEQWVLDESSEWYLTSEQAMQLGTAIHQAGSPKAARSGTG